MLLALVIAASCVAEAHDSDVVLMLTQAKSTCDWETFDPAAGAKAKARRIARTAGTCPETVVFDVRHQRAFVLGNGIEQVTWVDGGTVTPYAELPDDAERVFLSIPDTPSRQPRISWSHRVDDRDRADGGIVYRGRAVDPASFDGPTGAHAVVVVVAEFEGKTWKTIAQQGHGATPWTDEISGTVGSETAPDAFVWRHQLLDHDCARGRCADDAVPQAAERVARLIRSEEQRKSVAWLPLGGGGGLLVGTIAFDSVHATQPVLLCTDECTRARKLSASGARPGLDWRTIASTRQLAVSSRLGYAIVSPELVSGEVLVVSACGTTVLRRGDAVAAWVPRALGL